MERLDLQKSAEQNKIFLVDPNGPKLWAIDWFELQVGKLRDFDGLKAARVANADLKGIDLNWYFLLARVREVREPLD